MMLGTLLADSFFGEIQAPPALEAYGESGGLITLGNNLMWLAVIAGGIMTLFNAFSAGIIYISSSGDAKAHERVLSKLTMSLWGMAIMVLTPALMAVLGFVFFRNAQFFLQPQLQGIEITGSPAIPPTAPPGPCQPGPWNNYVCP